ncbi:MAG: hypothetical protein JWN90_305 [Parcubacteria group bacterium]|nr:hypothetical protein [Parcubacteria group bacterium]
MKHIFLILPLLLLTVLMGMGVPSTTFAQAKFASTTTNTSSPNTYVADTQVTITAPVTGDLAAFGGVVSVYAPVAGEVLAVGGTVLVEKPAGTNVRAIGGRVTVSGDAGGDIAAAGGSVIVTGHSANLFALGGTVDASGGSTGDVTIYGANVTLSGTYGGNVTVIASNRFTLANETHIAGNLRYNAPQQVTLPTESSVGGTTTYTGSYAYVPTNEEAQRYAIAGAGIFFIVRVIATIIVAGLLAGLFPVFTDLVIESVLPIEPRKLVLIGLLGFGLFVATPILILLLFVSFVGGGLALLLSALYLLLSLLAYVCAGILMGALLRRFVLYRLRGVRVFTWRDAIIGTVALYAVSLIPQLGLIISLLFTAVAAGAIAAIAYAFAFRTSNRFEADRYS